MGEPETYQNADYVRACGVVTDVRTRIDRSGRKMAFFKLDDFSGSCECLMFSKTYKDFENLIESENTILVSAKLESSGDEIKLNVEDAMSLEDARYNLTKKLILYLDTKKHKPEIIDSLKEVFENNEGNIPVIISVGENGYQRDFYVDKRILLNKKVLNSIRKILGGDNIRFSVI